MPSFFRPNVNLVELCMLVAGHNPKKRVELGTERIIALQWMNLAMENSSA